jgi:hypothetical protein
MGPRAECSGIEFDGETISSRKPTPMKHLWCTPLFLLLMAVALPAQEPLITADMPVDSGTLHPIPATS